MTREHRIAIARIISDIIRADNIIEESEIKLLHEYMKSYGIKRSHMEEARRMRFSDAVVTLQEADEKELPADFCSEFYDRINTIANSDNLCATREALMLVALQYCLRDFSGKDDAKGHRPYLISCAIGESSFDDLYMVYIEKHPDKRRNAELQEQFRLLVTVARLYGFNFGIPLSRIKSFINNR